MRLEAIAALLGHRTMEMTLICVVADVYQAISGLRQLTASPTVMSHPQQPTARRVGAER
jgi:hypothetical protein